jgi:hypothetical protein
MEAVPFVLTFGLFTLIAIAGFGLWVWALVDAIQVSDDAQYQSGTKVVWVLVIVLTGFVGAIIYLLIGRPKPGVGALPSDGSGASSSPPPPPTPPGALPPAP